MITEILVALIIGVFGGGGAINFFHVRSNNKKADADAASTLVGAAGQVVNMYRDQVEELEREVQELKTERDELKARVDHLEEKVEQLVKSGSQ